jgi:hypothetical protein
MMAIDNPILSLKNLNDLQDKVVNNTATVSDYEEIDFFISAIGGNKDYIKNSIIDNGFSDIEQYIKTKKENTEGKKVQIGIVYGTSLGALDFLKSYAIQNKFYI